MLQSISDKNLIPILSFLTLNPQISLDFSFHSKRIYMLLCDGDGDTSWEPAIMYSRSCWGGGGVLVEPGRTLLPW